MNKHFRIKSYYIPETPWLYMSGINEDDQSREYGIYDKIAGDSKIMHVRHFNIDWKPFVEQINEQEIYNNSSK